MTFSMAAYAEMQKTAQELRRNSWGTPSVIQEAMMWETKASDTLVTPKGKRIYLLPLESAALAICRDRQIVPDEKDSEGYPNWYRYADEAFIAIAAYEDVMAGYMT